MINQALLEYFGPEKQTSTSGRQQENEISVILTHIGDTIDCLMSLIPSLHGGSTLNRAFYSVQANEDFHGGASEKFTRLIQKVFPAVGEVIKERLVESLIWRSRLLRLSPGPSDSKKVYEGTDNSLQTLERDDSKARTSELGMSPNEERTDSLRIGGYPEASRGQPEKANYRNLILETSPTAPAPCPLCCVVVSAASRK
jgi:hypothetical protein